MIDPRKIQQWNRIAKLLKQLKALENAQKAREWIRDNQSAIPHLPPSDRERLRERAEYDHAEWENLLKSLTDPSK